MWFSPRARLHSHALSTTRSKCSAIGHLTKISCLFRTYSHYNEHQANRALSMRGHTLAHASLMFRGGSLFYLIAKYNEADACDWGDMLWNRITDTTLQRRPRGRHFPHWCIKGDFFCLVVQFCSTYFFKIIQAQRDFFAQKREIKSKLGWPAVSCLHTTLSLLQRRQTLLWDHLFQTVRAQCCGWILIDWKAPFSGREPLWVNLNCVWVKTT